MKMDINSNGLALRCEVDPKDITLTEKDGEIIKEINKIKLESISIMDMRMLDIKEQSE